MNKEEPLWYRVTKVPSPNEDSTIKHLKEIEGIPRITKRAFVPEVLI